MCGICGIIAKENYSLISERVCNMVHAMRHRGPDDSGTYVDGNIALGMARLAIIDVTPTGHQPMFNDEGTLSIVYNGECYNFKEERKKLEECGVKFHSSSDTEVVLRLYEKYGDDVVHHLRGMFAFAIYDKKRKRLFLARDHLGIKPLLYSHNARAFVFSSEMKTMLASGLVDRKIDPESLGLLLAYGSVPQPRTIVEGVKMLPPAHRMVVEDGKVKTERYWKFSDSRVDLKGRTYNELVEMTRNALRESVRLQMVSDVPIGAFLSGGVDSSLLVALMAKESGHKVRTFSVGFSDEGCAIDETDDAGRIAKHIGTEHTRVLITGKEVRDRIMHIASSLDQPSVDGVNSYFVSYAARQAVTVAISGTGGDEFFAGYPWFISMALYEKRIANHPLKSSLKRLIGKFACARTFDRLVFSKLGRYIERARHWCDFSSYYMGLYQVFGVRGANEILSQDMKKRARLGRTTVDHIHSADELPRARAVERTSALCMRTYTQNQLLRDIDAVSMGHSLEVRVPFLDHELADLALALPTDAKIGNVLKLPRPTECTYRETGRKRILIDIGKGLLPDGMDLQQKRGFGMPFDAWLKGPLSDVFEDALSSETVQKRGIFDEDAVKDIRDGFILGKIDWPKPWLLMIIELWCREVLDDMGKKTISKEGDIFNAAVNLTEEENS